jgi:hypothetical protein
MVCCEPILSTSLSLPSRWAVKFIVKSTAWSSRSWLWLPFQLMVIRPSFSHLRPKLFSDTCRLPGSILSIANCLLPIDIVPWKPDTPLKLGEVNDTSTRSPDLKVRSFTSKINPEPLPLTSVFIRLWGAAVALTSPILIPTKSFTIAPCATMICSSPGADHGLSISSNW